MTRLCLPLLSTLLFLSACAKPETTTQPVAPMSQGQQIFLSQCVSCHQGAGDPPGPNVVVLNSPTLKQEETFRALLRQPTSSMMRKFSAQELPDAEVHALYEYLSSLQGQ
ncbi:cytochrome c [Vampirovibrio sp.]|uniref:c-type cytochrome n=1 Tax=Vampirovibrio sp. TaxID=2717857 RepID=UPI0035937AAF